MLLCSDEPAKVALNAKAVLDRAKSESMVRRMFPAETLEPIESSSLKYTSPPNNEIYVGCYEGFTVVAAKEFGIDYPSKLPTKYLAACGGRYAYLHAMHSVVDWFAYAVWENSELVRSLSLSPDSGILEDIGEKLSFEAPYWAGEHPVFEPGEEEEYPFVFHPLELGEAALSSLFGYVLEGFPRPEHVDPEEIELLGFKRIRKPWWKVW